MNELVTRVYEGQVIYQRTNDRYMDATAMCRACGKAWADYWRLKTTTEYVSELSTVMGIPITELVEVRQGGLPESQGTWVHPRLAMNLAQWCSARFAVLVSGWMEELLTTGSVALAKPLSPAEMLVAQAQAMLDQERRITVVEQQQRQLTQQVEAAVETVLNTPMAKPGRYSIMGYANRINVRLDRATSSQIGRKMTAKCKSHGVKPEPVNDTVYGELNTYPEDLLKQYFETCFFEVRAAQAAKKAELKTRKLDPFTPQYGEEY